MTISDLISVFDRFREIVRAAAQNESRVQLSDARRALVVIHFSDQTLDVLKTIRDRGSDSDSDFDYLLGKLAIRQRDTEGNVMEQMQFLSEFSDIDGLSLGAQDLLGQVISGKLEIREAIKGAVMESHRTGNGHDINALVEAIELLNQDLKKIDDRLGGIIL